MKIVRPVATVLLVALALPSFPASAAPDAVPSWPGLLAVELAEGQDGPPLLPLVLGGRAVFPGERGDLGRWWYVEVPAGGEADALRSLLPHVARAERVPVRTPAGDPDDPRLGEQWHVRRVRAPEAWRVTRGSAATRIAVVDTGFEARHPDLGPSLTDLAGRRGAVQRYTGGCPRGMRFATHGTEVAGVAAATTDNGRGVAGVGFSSRIVAMQTGVVYGGACVVGPDWVTALHDAAVAGVPVANLSFAGPGYNALEAATVRDAVARGMLVVAAAGNGGTTARHFPGAYPHVVAVASLTADDRLRPTSNRGGWVDLAAPGEGLLTTCEPSTYCRVSGTSVAAPVVAGGAALALGRWPREHGLRLRHRVLDAAAHVTGRTLDPAIGAGRLDLARTVRERVVRLWGPDRVRTAAEVTQHARPSTADTVVLVPADAPGDSGWRSTLPAAGLLSTHRTAFVMTRRAALDPAAEVEILRLFGVGGATPATDRTVIIPGDPSVSISTAVEARLAERFTVQRIGSGGAAATAADLADAIVDRSGATTALVARGDDPADALSLAGPAARYGLPLLFVGRDAVPEPTCAWVAAHPEVERVVVAGGPAAVSPAVEEELRTCRGLLGFAPLEVARDAGRTRVETALAVASRWFPRPGGAVVANGWRWPDAVTGGSLSLAFDAPVLLTAADRLAPSVARYLDARNGPASRTVVLGGEAVVARAVEARLEEVAR